MKRRGRREEEEGRGGEMGRERGEKKARRRDREREREGEVFPCIYLWEPLTHGFDLVGRH